VEKLKKEVLAVCGSRTLYDERVKIILLEEIEKHNINDIVTHAEPEGVCALARDLCKANAIPLKLHFLNFRYLRGAFEHRSRDVFKDCTRAIFIHDGKSRGTSNEHRMAVKIGIPLSFFELEIPEYKTSVGFEPDSDWADNIEADLNALQIKEN